MSDGTFSGTQSGRIRAPVGGGEARSGRLTAKPAAAPQSRRRLCPAAEPQAAHRSHWLSWAIVGVAAVLGVIAIAAYRHNNHPCNTPSCGPP